MPECPLTSRQSSALAVTVHSSLSRQLPATAEAVLPATLSNTLYSETAVAVAVVSESSTLCAVLLWLTAGSSGEGHHVGGHTASTAGMTVLYQGRNVTEGDAPLGDAVTASSTLCTDGSVTSVGYHCVQRGAAGNAHCCCWCYCCYSLCAAR